MKLAYLVKIECFLLELTICRLSCFDDLMWNSLAEEAGESKHVNQIARTSSIWFHKSIACKESVLRTAFFNPDKQNEFGPVLEFSLKTYLN
jgi:hypothetical protein